MVKTIEFDSMMTDSDQLRLPTEVLQQIPQGSSLRVILVLNPDEDDLGPLRKLAMERFAAAYSENDFVYDDVPDDAQSR